MEDLKVDGQTAYWNYAGNFNDNSARANSANAGWWMYKWYGDLEGSQTVAVTPPALDTVDTLQGIAAIDTSNKRATVLYGGGSKPVSLNLTNLDRKIFGKRVDIEVREVTLSGAEGVAGTPPVVKVLDGVALDRGQSPSTCRPTTGTPRTRSSSPPSRTAPWWPTRVWTTSVEAEQTALTAATVYYQDPQSGGGWKFLASGSNDVGSFNRPTSKADWTVTVPRTGRYRFQVIGGTPGVPGRHALFVDGANPATVQYTADLALTSYQKWQYRGSAEVTMALTAGQHTLSLRASRDGINRAAQLRHHPRQVPADRRHRRRAHGRTRPRPCATPAARTSRYNVPQARGYAVIGVKQRADAYVQAWETGYYDLSLDYRSLDATGIDVTVNGRPVARLTAPRDGCLALHRARAPQPGHQRGRGALEAGHAAPAADHQPGAAADSAAVTIEAENAIRQGATEVTTYADSSGSNASGLQGARLGRQRRRATRSWCRAAAGFDKPGDYNVAVSFANAELSGSHAYNPQVIDRRLEVTETGGAAGTAHGYFRYTYAWNSFLERTIPVRLTTAGGSLVFGNPTPRPRTSTRSSLLRSPWAPRPPWRSGRAGTG